MAERAGMRVVRPAVSPLTKTVKPLESYTPEGQARAKEVFAGGDAAKALANNKLMASTENIDALHKAIDDGYISTPQQLEQVLTNASTMSAKAGRGQDTHALKEAIRRRTERQIKTDEGTDFANAAKESGFSEKEIREAAQYIAKEKMESEREYEAAKSALRKRIGFNSADIRRFENQHKDTTAIPGLEAAVRELASEFPGYFGDVESSTHGHSVEHGKALEQAWQMLKEGKRRPTTTKDYIGEAIKQLQEDKDYAESQKEKPLTEEEKAVPFRRAGSPERYLAQSPAELRAAVAEAARATHRTPSEAQRESGNYPKGKVRLHGMEIAIETPRGAFRSGKNKKTGQEWKTKAAAHYGYIKRTLSEADSDHCDVFIGPQPESELVFVIDQLTPNRERFDESKILLGFARERDAKDAYLASYSNGWKGFGTITATTLDRLKSWIEHGDTSKPFAQEHLRTSRKEE